MKRLFLFLFIFLYGCDNNNDANLIKPTMDRTGLPIVTTTYYYDSVEEVMAAYRAFHGIPKNRHIPRLKGFALWPEWIDEEGNTVEFTGDLWCEIHSIRPVRIDDAGTLTHGHEGVHCVLGSYHKD